jgi:lysophospholipase L1-like esterase
MWLAPWSGTWSDGGTTPAAVNGLVYQWNDMSGAGNHMTETTNTLRPKLDSDYVVDFPLTNVNGVMSSAGPTIDKRNNTIIVLVRHAAPAGATGGDAAISANGQSPTIFVSYDTTVARLFNGSLVSHTNQPTVNGCVFAAVSGSGGITYYSEQALSFSASSSGSVSGFQLAQFFNNAFRFHGRVDQALIWNRQLSSAEVSAVTQWLHGFEPYLTNYVRRIVCTGDSLTAGYGATNVLSYPYQLQQLEGATSRVYDIGVGGLTVTQIRTGNAYVSPGLTNFLVVMAGINDITAGTSWPTIYSNLWTFASNRNVAGFKTVGITILAADLTTSQESNRLALNTALKADTTNFLAVVDAASNTNLTNYAGPYYSGDNKHLSSGGYGVLASMIHAALAAF